MLPNTNAAQAEVFAVVLLDAIRAATFRVDGEPIRVTASTGNRLGDGSRSRAGVPRACDQSEAEGQGRRPKPLHGGRANVAEPVG
jgi:hypothetical protein